MATNFYLDLFASADTCNSSPLSRRGLLNGRSLLRFAFPGYARSCSVFTRRKGPTRVQVEGNAENSVEMSSGE